MEYGRSGHKQFDMCGNEQIRGETTLMTLGHDRLVNVPGIDAFVTKTEPQAN